MTLMSLTPHMRRRYLVDRFFRGLCLIAATLGVIFVLTFLYKIVADGVGRLDWHFVTSKLSSRPLKTGIWPALVGSLYVMGLTALFAAPIGVAAAVYLEEFTVRKNRITEFIQLNIANLAGVPSIVYGLLGLTVFVRWFALKQSILAGALTMSLLVLPMIILVTQEALKAVPRSYREGSLALGATHWQSIATQVLPNAAPGILTGLILAMSRAIGETAPLIVAGAVSMVTAAPSGLFDSYTVLPIQIFDWAGDAKRDFNVAAAAAIIVLMLLLLSMNSVAIYLRLRSQKNAH